MTKKSKNQLKQLILMKKTLIDFNEFFRKDVRFDQVKSHTKPGFYPLFRSHIFRKTTEVGLTLIEYLEIHAKFSQQKKLDIKISGKSQKLQIK